MPLPDGGVEQEFEPAPARERAAAIDPSLDALRPPLRGVPPAGRSRLATAGRSRLAIALELLLGG